MTELVAILAAAATIVGGIIVFIYAYRQRLMAQHMLSEARHQWESAQKDIDAEKREAQIQLKDELYKKRTEFDLDIKRERAELERFQIKLNGKYELAEKKRGTLRGIST